MFFRLRVRTYTPVSRIVLLSIIRLLDVVSMATSCPDKISTAVDWKESRDLQNIYQSREDNTET
jgi:hypothetical protein